MPTAWMLHSLAMAKLLMDAGTPAQWLKSLDAYAQTVAIERDRGRPRVRKRPTEDESHWVQNSHTQVILADKYRLFHDVTMHGVDEPTTAFTWWVLSPKLGFRF